MPLPPSAHPADRSSLILRYSDSKSCTAAGMLSDLGDGAGKMEVPARIVAGTEMG